MGKIDSDYLWLREQPRARFRLRRLALLLAIPLLGGAAWLTTGPEPFIETHMLSGGTVDAGQKSAFDEPADSNSSIAQTATDAEAYSSNRDEHSSISLPLALDGVSSTAQASPNHARNDNADIALSEQQHGAEAIPVAPLDPNRVLDDDAGIEDQAAVPAGAIPGSIALLDADADADHGAPRDGGLAALRAGDHWQDVTIHRGDTLSIAFSRNNLSYSDSLKIAHLKNHGQRFTRGLRAGDVLRVRSNGEGRVLELHYPVDALHTLEVHARNDGFRSRTVLTDVDHRKAYASGRIDTSFYVDALEAGLSDNQIMKLVKIFGWDIDFALDIRPGDRFVVVYDELFRDGDKVGDGDILAAAFTNNGRSVRAVRYIGSSDDEAAYYSPDGRAMKKAFIRTPVDYTRISSGFNLSRKHPILNRIRRHEGTDYAAPSGTPIKATGNGRIAFRGRRGGYGNMIIIQHDSHLSTRYGHMSRFARGLGVGSKVRQGDIIGYVGMTGLATGPHLHYEFRVDGAPKDPEGSAMPKSIPLPKKYLADFQKETAPLVAQLDTLSHTEVARADRILDDGAQ